METVTKTQTNSQQNSVISISDKALHRVKSLGITKFIADLLIKMSELETTKLGVLYWGEGHDYRSIGEALSVALSDQLQKKCAFICSEGIKIGTQSCDGYDLVYFPEVVLPENEKNFLAFQREIDKKYPLQVMLGKDLKEHESNSNKPLFPGDIENVLFLLPSSGISRNALQKAQNITKQLSLNVIGTIIVNNGSMS